MAHFAQIDQSGRVARVLVIEQDEIDTGAWGDPASWVKTSYNTRGGVYYTPGTEPPTPDPDQSKALRKNFAGEGDVYDSVLDAFYEPRPYPSWELDTASCLWQAPVPMPEPTEQSPGPFLWDEAAQQWVQADLPA